MTSILKSTMTNYQQLNDKFYNDFAGLHDIMLPIKNRLSGRSFFKHILKSIPSNSEILDTACGTGIHVIITSKLGYKVYGMDLSPGMIDQANKNIKKDKIKAVLKVGDFRKISSTYKGKQFAIVMCLGNSLAYMKNKQDLRKALKSMYEVLNPNGLMIISQRNYDEMLKEKKTYTVTQRGKYIFLYIYSYLKKKITFNIVVGIKGKERASFKTFETVYTPILKEDLEKYMRKIGYENIKFYNQDNEKESFKFDEKNDDFYTIVGVKRSL